MQKLVSRCAHHASCMSMIETRMFAGKPPPLAPLHLTPISQEETVPQAMYYSTSEEGDAHTQVIIDEIFGKPEAERKTLEAEIREVERKAAEESPSTWKTIAWMTGIAVFGIALALYQNGERWRQHHEDMKKKNDQDIKRQQNEQRRGP